MQMINIAENALMIKLGDTLHPRAHQQLIALQKAINTSNKSELVEAVIGYTTLVIYFNPLQTSHNKVAEIINELCNHSYENSTSPTLHHIPVCYEEEFSPDIHYVAKYNHLTIEEVINLHLSPIYTVYFIGFSPGFPFLGGMCEEIATPRKATPRQSIHGGSVGIAGKQTGIYPSESPGGWQVIGRTPKQLVTVDNKIPTRFQSGDQIKFYQIDSREFAEIAACKEPGK
ncbi:5-oxoprolinase subunit PxpB [Gracilibacillus xinjiangensis]|uniref:5-oxoprolinase subunit PxpB n=1 Tax=Gracilibacillus xinjiangensis TaxID=1193282 RepID=A0ABV8WTY9_9BACI